MKYWLPILAGVVVAGLLFGLLFLPYIFTGFLW